MTGRLSKLVGGAIGLGQELSAEHKKRKETEASKNAQANPIQGSDVDEDEDEDDDDDDEELAQELDAAGTDTISDESSGDFNEETWTENFLKTHPPPPYNRQQPAGMLSMPVLIPEKRPGARSRGFVRAYAPILHDAGIDESTWMDFLQGFDKSIANNKWFHVANVAVAIAGKIRLAIEGISLIAHAVILFIHISIETGRRVYMNKKQNTFLDRMNDEFFKPRGLYCLVITYDPKSNEPDEFVDVERTITHQVSKRDDKDRSGWRDFASSSDGKARYEAEVPEFAPLVFPQLDNINETKKQNAIKHYGSVVADYYDRRAQATFDADNEDSKLSGKIPRQDFAGKWSDPTNPAAGGHSMITTLTGGRVQHESPLNRLAHRRNAFRSKLGISREAGKQGRQKRKSKRPLRRFLKENMLYLLIVNMPTQEEMDTVAREFEEAKQQKKLERQKAWQDPRSMLR